MQPVILDLESFYTDVKDARGRPYSLSHLSTEEYVRHEWFEAHGASIKWSVNHNARWYPEKELRYVLKEHDWSDTFLITHHHQWDGFALLHHYGVLPRMRGCTLSMARLMLGNHIGVSLDSVRKHFGLPPKTTPYNLFYRKHFWELTPFEQEQVADGCCDETESVWKIFCALMEQGFPAEELSTIDITMKMFCEPVLRADINMLAEVWESEAKNKQTRLAALNVSPTELQSADKFAALLEAEGVEIEYKDGKNKQIPAFAKTDDFMRSLLEHENDRIRALAEARVGQKATLLQTRAETLGFMASRGFLCIYLFMYGAHTLRWSGGDGANFQNLPARKPEARRLRESILAPGGYILVKPDLSQIEARLLAFLASQEDLVEKFRRGEDPYSELASSFYGRQITKEDVNERGSGKQGILSCGYGCGGKRFQATARAGTYGPPVMLTLEESQRRVDIYREKNTMITAYWKQGGQMLKHLANGSEVEWGPMVIRDHRVWLPNGTALLFDTLEWHVAEDDQDETGWRLRTRKGWVRIWGSKFVENVIQALARVVISQSMIRIARHGYRVVNTEHDSLWILIPKDGYEQQHLDACKAEMTRPLPWLPGLPLACEGELK